MADAINRAMEATQNAIQSRNRVAQVEAEATQAITQAHGAAEAARQKAQGDADALLITRARRGAGQRDHPPVDDARPSCSTARSSTGTASSPTYNAGALPMLTFDVGKGGPAWTTTPRESGA